MVYTFMEKFAWSPTITNPHDGYKIDVATCLKMELELPVLFDSFLQAQFGKSNLKFIL